MPSKLLTNLRAKTKNAHFGTFIAASAILTFMVMMLVNPAFYLDSARRGLRLYATSVLPSLFPFYFCSLLLTYIGAARTVSSVFGRPVKLLYNAPKESAYALILSMLSGYPVGASMTYELYSAGLIDRDDVKTIASFASTSGPIFILGTVGGAIFDSPEAGAAILGAHYLAALINGLMYRKRNRRSDVRSEVKISAVDHDGLMSKTISTSTLSMLYVGGYIVLCGMIVDTLSLFHIDELLLNALGDASSPVYALICGVIEMTRGCVACAECAPKSLSISLAAAIISLGGLSVTLQNYTYLSKCGMKVWQIALRKLTHAALAFGLCMLFCIGIR